MKPDEKRSLLLQAYCDGELSRFARFRMEHKLRRSDELRRELAEWVELSRWVRELDAAEPARVTPDSWSEIGPALSAIDREIASNRATGVAGWFKADGVVRSFIARSFIARSFIERNWGSLAATGALAVLVLAVVSLDVEDGISAPPLPSIGNEVASGSLRYLKTNGVSYVVARDADDVTIIWLMEPAGAPEGA